MEFLDILTVRNHRYTEAQVKRWKASISPASGRQVEQDFVVTVGQQRDDRRAYRVFVVSSGSGAVFSHVIVLSKLGARFGDYGVIGGWTVTWPTVDVSVAPDGTLSVEGRATGFGKEVCQHVLRVNLNYLWS